MLIFVNRFRRKIQNKFNKPNLLNAVVDGNAEVVKVAWDNWLTFVYFELIFNLKIIKLLSIAF